MNISTRLKNIAKNADKENFIKAEEELLKLLLQYPNNINARELLGQVYLKTGKIKEAIDQFEKKLSLTYDNNTANILLEIAIKNKLWKTAYDCVNLMLNNSQDERLYLIKAQILKDQHNESEVIKLYELMIKKGYSSINIYISYGYILNKLNRFEEATKIYRKGLEQYKSDYNLHYNLGVTLGNLKLYQDGIEHLKIALDKDKYNLKLLLTLASFQHKVRRFNDANESLSYAKKLDPENYLVNFQLGTLLMQSGKTKEGLEYLKKAKEKNPEDAEVNYHIGLGYMRLGEIQKGITYYSYRTKRNKEQLGRFDDTRILSINKSDNLVIRWEQGIGDQLLISRLLETISQKVNKVIYVTQDKLYKFLLINITGVEIVKESDFKEENYEKEYKFLNLYSILKFIELPVEISRSLPAYKADLSKAIQFRKKYKNNDKKLVGLSWFSKNEKFGDEKSFPLEIISSLGDFDFLSLQYGDVKEDVDAFYKKYLKKINLDDRLDYFDDILGLASLISCCDFVITCSNVTAHLSGALGIKTYLLLPTLYGRIWYWYQNKSDQIWYKDIEIIEQENDMDWESAIKKLKERIGKSLH